MLLDRYEALNALKTSDGQFSNDSAIKLWESGLHDLFWYIRKKSIEESIGFINNQSPELINRLLPDIERIAMIDKNSAVRVAALSFLQDHEGSKSNDFSLKALHDSSYMVVATAIHNV